MSDCLTKKISEKTEVSTGYVQIVWSGYQNQIRRVGSSKQYLARIILDLAKSYVKEASPRVISECVKLVQTKYNHLAVSELSEAYRLWSVGEIAKDEKAYTFTVKHFGTILTAYSKKRNNVLAETLRVWAEKKDKAETETRRKKEKEAFEKWFPSALAQAKGKYSSWRDIPSFWFRAAWRRKLIRLSDDEVCAIRAEAIQLAKIEMHNEGDIWNIDSIVTNTPKLEAKRDIIAGKIAIFRKFCQ